MTTPRRPEHADLTTRGKPGANAARKAPDRSARGQVTGPEPPGGAALSGKNNAAEPMRGNGAPAPVHGDETTDPIPGNGNSAPVGGDDPTESMPGQEILASDIRRERPAAAQSGNPGQSGPGTRMEALAPGRRAVLVGRDGSPFAGLAAFQEADADRFFGRDREIEQIVTELRTRPLVAVVARSGAGKSSLVRAGVIPALKRSGDGWDAHVVRPGRDPLAALAGILAHRQGASDDLGRWGGDASDAVPVDSTGTETRAPWTTWSSTWPPCACW